MRKFAIYGKGGIGKSTTKAVVVSIFLVILVDAIFSVMFSQLGI